MPELIALSPIPLMTRAALLGLRVILNSQRVLGKLCWLPFGLMVIVMVMVMVMVLGFLCLAYSLSPFVMMNRMTIRKAAAAPKSLALILWGCAFAVPAILVDTVFAYEVFLGKVGALTCA